MRPLCPVPVKCSVPALQHRLLAPVDLLHHLLMLGDLLLHPHDGDRPLPAPDDGLAQGKGLFSLFLECFSDQDVQRIEEGDISGPQTRQTGCYGAAYRDKLMLYIRPQDFPKSGLTLPSRLDWDRFSSRQTWSIADILIKIQTEVRSSPTFSGITPI